MLIECRQQIKDGQVNKDGIATAVKLLSNGDEQKMKLGMEISDECVKLTDPDPCEASIKIGLCLKESAAKKKVDFGI